MEGRDDTEHLEGALGKSTYFRPERYRPKDLGPVQPALSLTVAGQRCACEMVDVAQGGVACRWPAGAAPRVGGRVADLRVAFDGYEAYRGGARISSVREVGDHLVVGLSFIDSLMNIADVLQLRQLREEQRANDLQLGVSHRPWNVSGHERFKALVAELRLFLLEVDAELGKIERSLPWQVVHGSGESSAREALVEELKRDFVPPFVRYTEEIDRAVRRANEEEWASLKEFSQRHLQDLFMRAPFMHRCRTKPLGYPGDFEVMRFLYRRHFEGQTLLANDMEMS